MRDRRARRSGEAGQASVELALLLPLVLLLLLAILQVGLLARDVVLVGHASREAARAAAADPAPGAAGTAARHSSGLDPDRLSVAVSGRGGPGSRVRVTVTYRAPTDVPLVGALLGEPTMRSSTTMRVETPRPADQPRRRLAGRHKPDKAVDRAVGSHFAGVPWKDLRCARRNGNQGRRTPWVLGRSPSGTDRLSLHHRPPQNGSGGTLRRIQTTCSSERLPPWPAQRCWHC